MIHSLKALCNGHPGLTRASLSQIQSAYKIGENVTEEDLPNTLMLYISDGSLFEKLLSNTRCFISVSIVAAELKLEVNTFFEVIKMMLVGSRKYLGKEKYFQ